MESKYKERIETLIDDNKILVDGEGYVIHIQDVRTLMCQLAEEVEKDMLNYFFTQKFEYSKDLFYTKQQVEELLQKQRELIIEKAQLDFGVGGYVSIDYNSILNAKLEI